MNPIIKKLFLILRKIPLALETKFDHQFLADDIPMAKMVSHENWQPYLYEIGNKSGMRILEIGSREVTAKSNARKYFSQARVCRL